MRVQNPELFPLSLVDWQLFCTFTFRQERLPERVRRAIFYALLRRMAGNSGLHLRRVMWVCRQERGETFGRLHYHALIAGLPSHYKNWITCNSIQKLWVKFGGGHAKVSEYNPTLSGVDYILKEGDEMARSLATRWAGDHHEFTKFGGSCDLTLSESLLRHVYQRSLHGRWGRGETWPERKRRLLGQTGRLNTMQSGVTGSLFDTTG
jgi:hypothetical protein